MLKKHHKGLKCEAKTTTQQNCNSYIHQCDIGGSLCAIQEVKYSKCDLNAHSAKRTNIYNTSITFAQCTESAKCKLACSQLSYKDYWCCLYKFYETENKLNLVQHEQNMNRVCAWVTHKVRNCIIKAGNSLMYKYAPTQEGSSIVTTLSPISSPIYQSVSGAFV